MKILLLGASSYVGARLYVDLKKDFEVTGTYSSNRLSDVFVRVDITRTDEVHMIIEKTRPDVIIHAANNASSTWCEKNEEKARELNELSTRYIVDAANEIQAKVIYISSFAALQPMNVYSETKRHSEEIVKMTQAGWIILQPSLILGYSPNTSNDRPFNRLLRNLDGTKKAEYDTSWKFQPTWIGHISEVIKIVLDRNIKNEIIPIASVDLVSRYDVARDILSPFDIPVSPIDTHDRTATMETRLVKLTELNLPVHTYQEVVDLIVKEIRNKEVFNI
ncbi:MAG: sugar nucleotide-binding protein [Patescibacteria group bacterium]